MELSKNIIRGLTRLLKKMKDFVYYKIHLNPIIKKLIIDQFHILYYNSFYSEDTWANTQWLGVKSQKYSSDLWTYQEIVYELKPDLIVETGTMHGGSALFLASICDTINKGNVLQIK